MSLGAQIAWDDTVLPFQLDASDIRGRVARLDRDDLAGDGLVALIGRPDLCVLYAEALKAALA